MATTEYLIARVQQGGDEARGALESLYQRYHRRVLFHVRVRMGPSLRALEAPSDIAQEAMKESLGAMEGFVYRSDGAFMAFLAHKVEQTICDRVAYWKRKMRDAGQTVPLDDESRLSLHRGPAANNSHGDNPGDVLCLGEDLERLAAAMDQLREEQVDYWEAIVARDLKEMSFREIGGQSGKSADAVKQQYYRARARLALLFGADAG
jgi:RNA polymerase sigma factor (sigma-70 family)